MVVITDVYNPFNATSFFYFLRNPEEYPYNCGGGICAERIDFGITRLNAAITDQWQILGQPERLQIAGVRSVFVGHESPRPYCGASLPEVGDTWIQYPDDPKSNSILRLPGWAKEFIDLETGNGDCFHPNEAGANAYADAVVDDVLRLLEP
jgi:hypothetical protein